MSSSGRTALFAKERYSADSMDNRHQRQTLNMSFSVCYEIHAVTVLLISF